MWMVIDWVINAMRMLMMMILVFRKVYVSGDGLGDKCDEDADSDAVTV
jgi:hypothetical protein